MNTQRITTMARGQSLSSIVRPLPVSSHSPRSTVRFSLQSTAYSLRPAFTLVELLVVISIIAILLGIVVPTYFSVREKAKYTKAKVTVKNLETAFKAYLDHYRTWPSTGILKEDTAVPINLEAFKMLRGDSGIIENPDAIAFYEFDTTNYVTGALDPWSDPSDSTTWKTYFVRVDANYDNQISVGGQPLYRSVIVWSVGTNRTISGDDGSASSDVGSWN